MAAFCPAACSWGESGECGPEHTAQRIREQPWGKHMVLIALTGWGQEDDRKRSKEAGFDSHMVKPVELPTLMNLLAGLRGVRV